MYQRGVEQVRPRLSVSGHHHLHLDLDVIETFPHPVHGSLRTRVVIRNADGKWPTIAKLDIETLELSYPGF